jgi:hypothetical protein
MPTEPGLTSSTSPVAAGRRKLDVDVAEHEPCLCGPASSSSSSSPGWGANGAHVGDGRGVHEARAGHLGLGREPPELVGERVAERGAHVGDRRLQAAVVRRRGGVAGPAVDVAADPGRRLQLAQAGDGLRRPGAEQRVVAAEHPPARAGGARVRENRVESVQVSVHVVENGDHSARKYPTPSFLVVRWTKA